MERREEASVAAMREAAELETTTPKHAVTPGPTLPAWELLGDLLLDQEKPAEAAAAYRRALELYPRRFRSLLGAARAAHAAGDDAAARASYRLLVEVADAASTRPELTEARRFVGEVPEKRRELAGALQAMRARASAISATPTPNRGRAEAR